MGKERVTVGEGIFHAKCLEPHHGVVFEEIHSNCWEFGGVFKDVEP